MAMPKSVTKVNRDGVQFISSVDRVQHTIQELSRAALQDTAKYLRRMIINEIQKLPGMRWHRRPYASTQYWVRRREADLQIGFKHDAWYGARSEFGDSKTPGRHILRDTVYNNIDTIRVIQGQYLSAIEDENRALGLIDEREAVGEDDSA